MAPMSYVTSSRCVGGGGGKDKDVNLRLLRNGALLKRLDLMIEMKRSGWSNNNLSMREEIRSLNFWRSVIAECLASFFYIFFTCGSYTLSSDGKPISDFQVALVSGSAMATLILCFGPISGAHVNPAVSAAFAVTRKISLLRMFLYITAQCGGAVAGTALLYGMSNGGDSDRVTNSALVLKNLSAVQGFGVESLLTFMIVMTIFATLDPYQSPVFNYPSPLIGLAYLTCSLTGISSTGAALNPARALGPSFVTNKWSHHWVYWGGPIAGAILAALIYEYVFDNKRNLKEFQQALEDLQQGESSLQSNDDDCDAGDHNILSSPLPPPPPTYPSQSNVYHTRYDDYCRPRGGGVGGGGASNYAHFQPPPPPPASNDYRNYAMEQQSNAADSIYESASAYNRPISSASRNYSSIYGTRKVPQRMDSIPPGSTKF